MSNLRILSVGYEFPGGGIECVGFMSRRSLLDADLIIYEPTLGNYRSDESYKGKPALTEDSSFRVDEALSHWRSELTEAIGAGKVIILFLASPKEVFVCTGRKDYSGTGRSQTVTNFVIPASSYDAIPFKLQIQERSGDQIIAEGDLGYLAPYWSEFADDSPYEVTISGEFDRILLRTRSGNAIVGAITQKDRGTVLLLPPVRYDEEAFIRADDDENLRWNDLAQKYGKRLATSITILARVVKSQTDDTPPPVWSNADEYCLPQEEELRERINRCLKEIEATRKAKVRLEAELRNAGRLRSLLYEGGRPLERSIIEALLLFGFTADGYTDDESQFDVVFTSDEGRFLGEAEGKDKRAVNIEKLSQLERNLQEDFAKDEVTEYAKGVLFGNAHRLTPLADRGDAFTTKCLTGAKRVGVALVRTADLFEPARYLLANDDADYATRCRQAIANASGVVVDFPKPPRSPKHQERVVEAAKTG